MESGPQPVVPCPPSDTSRSPAARTGKLGLFSRLRVRLLLLVLLAWLPVVGLVVYSSFSDRTRARANAEQNLMRIINTIAHRQQEYISSGRKLLSALSSSSNINPENAERVQDFLERVLTLREAYADIGAVDVQGRVFASAAAATNRADYSQYPFFQTVLRHQKFVDNDYRLDRASAASFLYMGSPVLSRSNHQVRAVLYAALRLDWVCQFMPKVDLLENSTLTIVDRQENLLLRYPDPEKKWVGQTLKSLPVLRQLLARNIKGTGRGIGPDGVEFVYVFTPLSSTRGIPDAWVVAAISAEEVFADARLMLVKNLTFLGLIGVLALSAAWFGGDVFVLQPVRKLAQATQSIRQENFNVAPDIPHAPSELVGLAQDFSVMAHSLEQRIAERKQAEAELRQLNEELEMRVADRTRELQRSNEELEQFAYVASHDLQEPLRMVISYMQLLEQRYADKLDANARDFIGFATDGAQRMQRLINDLLTYSRVGTRQRPIEPTDMNQVIEGVLLDLKVAIEESGAVITHDALPVVQGDTVQLSQLLQNLIGNAIKFRGAQPPAIHVSAVRCEPGTETQVGEGGAPMWQFTVRDNGIGIASEHFQRIFVIFQRLHGRGKYAGTGIGLAICKKIVERHQGRIWPESEPGQGTRFCFTLPGSNAAEPTPV